MQQHYFSQNGTHFVSELKVNNQAISIRTLVQMTESGSNISPAAFNFSFRQSSTSDN